MLRFYTNRQLAARLDINLARWKRWSREFLPPDPLGGLQSGLARQYTAEEAFMVFLAGHLVSELNFSIPEARRILSDLHPVLKDLGIIELLGRLAAPTAAFSEGETAVHLRIVRLPSSRARSLGFGYQLRRCLRPSAPSSAGVRYFEEMWVEGRPDGGKPKLPAEDWPSWRTLNITGLHRRFVQRLNPADARW